MNDPLIVDTSNGPVRGISDGVVSAWLGIRYAAPPTGDLRWRAPQPPRAGPSRPTPPPWARCVRNRQTRGSRWTWGPRRVRTA